MVNSTLYYIGSMRINVDIWLVEFESISSYCIDDILVAEHAT